METAVRQLRSHKISELFLQTLGWQMPSAAQPIDYLNQRCSPIAERDGVVLWQVLLHPKTALTSALRHQIYTALQTLSQTTDTNGTTGLATDPLVVFLASDKLRSLWCDSVTSSALYVVGSPMTLWRFRLRRFAVSGRGLFPTSESASKSVGESASESASETTFQTLLDVLSQSIHGIERDTDRSAYSRLTLQRLMFIQQIQQKGWLNGDTWYLHNRFGELVTRGENLFFANCLQPLYRSLSLPVVERPLALQQSVGRVPFLGQLFEAHWLEEKYESIGVADDAFEAVLGWLSEQSSGDRLNPWINDSLCDWLGQGSRSEGGVVRTPLVARRVCDRSLDMWFLSQLDAASSGVSRSSGIADSTAVEEALNDRLFNADVTMCCQLVQEILPQVRVLDPGCGEGNLLVAFHQRLTEICCILAGCVQQNQDAQLQMWRAALYKDSSYENSGPEGDLAFAESQDSVFLKNVQERILKNNLYGVGESLVEVESAHFQLLLHLIATTQESLMIEPLIDLEFSVIVGNPLVGFVAVDEERFEQVNKAGEEDVLQGDLLQPLAADSYQTILSEKNIALEHYQSRTQVLAQAHSVPFYARAALLREEIVTLDSKAQKKLDALLLNQMGPQMGMRYRELQLMGKPRRRSLSLSDVETLMPLHWGYQFNKIVRKGGFDVVACCPPSQVLKPTVAEFLEEFPDLAKRHQLSQKTFKTSKAALQNSDPEVANAWLRYQDRCGFAADYFARSEDYGHQTAAGSRKVSALRRDRLFTERCAALLASKGVSAVVLSDSLVDDPAATSLVGFLQSSGDYNERLLENIAEDTAEGVVVRLLRE